MQVGKVKQLSHPMNMKIAVMWVCHITPHCFLGKCLWLPVYFQGKGKKEVDVHRHTPEQNSNYLQSIFNHIETIFSLPLPPSGSQYSFPYAIYFRVKTTSM